MDADNATLKQAVFEKLRRNGTLDRIQAELRSAVFLAVESDKDDGMRNVKDDINSKTCYSIIYHFLRQNRFLATATVFEKEIHQNIISFEELKGDANIFPCSFQLIGDCISLTSRSINEFGVRYTDQSITDTKDSVGKPYTLEANFDEANRIRSCWETSSSKQNKMKPNDEPSPSPKASSNLKNATLVELSRSSKFSNEYETINSFTESNESSEKHVESDRSVNETQGNSERTTLCSSSSEIPHCSERTKSTQQKQISKEWSLLKNTSQHKQSIKPQLSMHQIGKLPPIISRNEAESRLPFISMNRPPVRTGLVLSSPLNSALNPSSSDKNEKADIIVKELSAINIPQCDNNSISTGEL